MRDTGTGITSEEMLLLFTRFGKLQRTASINSGGLGLGLTIVKQILELAGGKIDVYSDGKDTGSCFTFSMPLESVLEELTAQEILPQTPKP